jgi:hypothetical protein
MDQPTAAAQLASLTLPRGITGSLRCDPDTGAYCVHLQNNTGWLLEYTEPAQQPWAQTTITAAAAT